MKSLILGVALSVTVAAAMLPSAALAQVSVSIGQPGFYGRLDVGNFAPAPVLYGPRPVVIAPTPVYGAAPVYLRVPRYQHLNWGRYCGYYDACGVPVLFVRDEWYAHTYVPAYRAYYGPPRGYYGGPRPYAHGYGHAGDWGHGRPGWDGDHRGGWDHGPGHGFQHGGGYGDHGSDHGDHGGGHGGGGHDHGHR